MPDIPVSKHYRSTVSELYKAQLENRITEQELSQRLDEAIEEEAKRQDMMPHDVKSKMCEFLREFSFLEIFVTRTKLS